MANAEFIKPQHIGRLFYSYWDGSAWSSHVEITDTFLNDPTKSHTGTVSGLASLSDDLVEKDRFIMYYGSYVNGTWVAGSGTLDCIAMAQLSQTSGLTFKTYADDSIALGSVPTTLIDTHEQDAGDSAYNTKSELIEFTETTKACFMVERQDIESYNGGQNVNLLVNGDFETGDFTGWTTTGSPTVTAVSPLSGFYHAVIPAGSGQEVSQSITPPAQDYTFKYSFRSGVGGGAGKSINIDGASISYVSESNYSAASIVEYEFDVLAAETSITITHASGGVGDPAIDDCGLFAIGGTVYTGSPLDTGAIIFGSDAVTTDINFQNGSTFDSSRKHSITQSAGRAFAVKDTSLRQDAIPYKLLSDTDIVTVETLDKELNNGLCIYRRDGSSTDERDWYIGLLQLSKTTGDYTDINSIKATVTELVERL